MEKKNFDTKKGLNLKFLFLAEIILILILISFFGYFVTGEVGRNATVITYLQVGNVYPEILNVSIDDGAASVTLIANATKVVSCSGLLRDYNNDSDFSLVNAAFWDTAVSTYGGANDNNYHYTNSSCNITRNFTLWNTYVDDDYLALANCSFSVQYYANPSTWNCTMWVNDSMNWNDTQSDLININSLLAVGLPASINYGTVNATYVSLENVTNVTNFGNVRINLSLSGYAGTVGDGRAMNCTLGSLGYISIEHEKYNVTTSTVGQINLATFQANYRNLTSDPVVNRFDLNYRQDDINNEASNVTYWRIYVPIGVAGSCQGNVVFGATLGAAS